MRNVVLQRPSRVMAGHLWIFSNELTKSPKGFRPGELVEVRDKKDNFLGIGYINPNSLISVRILTRRVEEINGEFFRKRILDALEYRRRFITDKDAYRAVYSEGDFLPGLIVDRYADCLSVQFLTYGMDAMSETILKALDEVFSPKTIVVRNDSQSRTLEGLGLEKKIVKGGLDELPVVKDSDLSIEVDPLSGQKTGFFLDQAENRAAFSALAGDGRGLDLFSYSGLWSLRLAKKGVRMTGVDSSEAAVALAEKNARKNGLAANCEFIKADAFDYLKAHPAGEKYDYIVLDPPAFVKSKARINEALRAYREVNASVMKMLKYGGLLATSSCSYHVDRTAFLEVLRAAARDAGKQARIIEMRSQAKDHPVSLTVPETEYLKCMILEVL